MCGIIGCIGHNSDSVEIVLDCLKKMEYRGYDSAGISFVDEKNIIHTFKTTGRIKNLAAKIDNYPNNTSMSIGHTRWATHGRVLDLNAHPHYYKNLSLIHNGIIENFSQLKSELESNGYKFISDTDSEIFLALVDSYMQEGYSFFESFSKSFQRVKGKSAFVMLNNDSNEILSVRNSAPLVFGINKFNSQAYVCSDPYALIGRVDKMYFTENNVVSSLSLNNNDLISFFELTREKSKRYTGKPIDINKKLSILGKNGFEHYTIKEIHEQPSLIRNLIKYYLEGEGCKTLALVSKQIKDFLYITACGTAYYAGLIIRDFFEKINGIPTQVELASEFRYRNILLNKNSNILLISQSGETADTLAAKYLCKELGIPSISVVNVEESTLARESDFILPIKAGVEVGVASTKAFTAQALVGLILSSFIKNSKEELRLLSSRINLLADRVESLLKNTQLIIDIARKIYNKRGFLYTGKGMYYPVALEGALKLKEMAYVHAEGYASGELKHGPIAMVDEEMVNIAIVGPELYEKTLANVEEIKARGGVIVLLAPYNISGIEKVSDYFIPLNFENLNELSPLYVNVVNQLLAYSIAKFKGTDIDKPRNLAKSVTVE